MLRNKEKIDKIVKLLNRIDKVLEYLESIRNNQNYIRLSYPIQRLRNMRELKARPITSRKH